MTLFELSIGIETEPGTARQYLIGGFVVLAPLDAHPEIRTVTLSRRGGRLGPGLRLGRLITRRDFSTYVGQVCAGSCTRAYMAGRQRFLRKEADIAFHAPAIKLDPSQKMTSIQDRRLQQQVAHLRQCFSEAGVPDAFIQRIMSTPFTDVWVPSAQKLLNAGMVTEIVH